MNEEESLTAINTHLQTLKIAIERTVPSVRVIHKPDVWKLMCTLDYATVKIEVNGTKRGIIEPTTDMMLCERAQLEFALGCKLKSANPEKHQKGVAVLQNFFKQ